MINTANYKLLKFEIKHKQTFKILINNHIKHIKSVLNHNYL